MATFTCVESKTSTKFSSYFGQTAHTQPDGGPVLNSSIWMKLMAACQWFNERVVWQILVAEKPRNSKGENLKPGAQRSTTTTKMTMSMNCQNRLSINVKLTHLSCWQNVSDSCTTISNNDFCYVDNLIYWRYVLIYLYYFKLHKYNLLQVSYLHKDVHKTSLFAQRNSCLGFSLDGNNPDPVQRKILAPFSGYGKGRNKRKYNKLSFLKL